MRQLSIMADMTNSNTNISEAGEQHLYFGMSLYRRRLHSISEHLFGYTPVLHVRRHFGHLYSHGLVSCIAEPARPIWPLLLEYLRRRILSGCIPKHASSVAASSWAGRDLYCAPPGNNIVIACILTATLGN